MNTKKILMILLIFILVLNPYAFADNSFDINRVYVMTQELSSDKYRGRLAGDSGNTMAANFIAKEFQSIGLSPAGNKGTYFQSFDVYVPMVNESCTFKVYDKTRKLIKQYTYGKDFKEATLGASSSGVVFGRLRDNSDKLGEIKLIDSPTLGEDTADYTTDASLVKSGIDAVIYPVYQINSFRTPYKLQKSFKDGLIKVLVNLNTSKELSVYAKNGYYFEIKSSVNINKVKVNNVIGKIDGKDKSLPPFILSAHFDHVGFDADGTIYPGALDNASGTSFLIECARYFKDKEPNRTIVFAAFNAEEEGLIGSEYFVTHPTVNITNAEDLNFDMVGSAKKIPLTLLSSPTRQESSKKLKDAARSSSVGINTMYEDNSDHAPFCANGINSTTLIHSDDSKIHSPEDTIDNIDKDRFMDVFKVTETYMESKGVIDDLNINFNTNSYDIYFRITGILAISIAAFIIFKKIRRNKKK